MPEGPQNLEGISEAGTWLRLPLDMPRVGRRSLTSWPAYDDDEIEAVARVLRSGKVNYWTGEEGRKFEDEFAEYTGAGHAVALANGTVALEAAFLGLGLKPGDEFVVSPRTFVASAGAGVLHGLRPVFADVDPVSQNITPETIERALTPRTRAIVAVHLAGWPCDMDGIMRLARQYGLKVIEDCAQAHGAFYRDRHVGTLGDVGVFSFCQDKIITTGGEGGMLITDSGELADFVWSHKDHGKSREAVYEREHPPGFRWLHDSFGTNWRLTETQSAMGRMQLRKLEAWVLQRRFNAELLNQRFAQVPGLRVTLPSSDVYHSYYRYYVFVEPDQLADGWSRDRILEAFEQQGIPGRSGSCPEIYLERAFDAAGLRPEQRLPVARRLGETSIAFPVHHRLGAPELEPMGEQVAKVMEGATK